MRNEQIKTCISEQPVGRSFKVMMLGWALAALTLGLSGCGDSPQSQSLLGGNGDSGAYKGPNPADDDVRSFKLSFWDPLRETGDCAGCHDSGQTPEFVNSADINDAYSAARTVVDVLNPANSRIVDKVGRGHHCWLGDNYRGCADIMQRFISNWLGASSDDGRAVVLTAPPLVNPTDIKQFPATAQEADFGPLHDLLTDNCASCHATSAAAVARQAPFFADSDINVAYEAAKSKMDLSEVSGLPDKSRFVIRLRNEFHNCWTGGAGGCLTDAGVMEAAIIAFSNSITAPAEFDTTLIASYAMTLEAPPAVIASGGSRYESNLIALWEFKETAGSTSTTIIDTSGVTPLVNLTLTGDDGATSPSKYYQWVNGYGIEFLPCSTGVNCGRAQSASNATKLRSHILQSGEYSVEAWVIPANVTQEGKTIVSMASTSSGDKNFTMAQTMYNYDFINRTNLTDGTANSQLSTDPDDEDLQATLQHVVMNFDPVNGRQIYVNGVSTGDSDLTSQQGGSVASWQDFSLYFGADQAATMATSWTGKLRMVAVHKRALTAEQIRQNYAAGVGQKYLLLFSIEHRLGAGYEQSYIMFEVEQYDNYAYLFSTPKFINLNPNWTPPSSIVIKGIRIGVNGTEATSGQAFANMDTSVTSAEYTFADGQLLSSRGTIIAAEFETDQFFLTFETLAGQSRSYTEATPSPVVPVNVDMVSKIGIRTFDEINASMSAITGIPVTQTDVSTTFNTYRRQLPAVENVQAYLSSHQMAVAQLAMKYCDVLVRDRKTFFSPFSFTQVPSVAFANATGRNNVLNPLLRSIMNIDTVTPSKNLGSQPDVTQVRDMLSSDSKQVLGDGYTGANYEFDSLMDCMTRCERGLNECATYVGENDTAACTGPETTKNTLARTEQVVKATCAAVLGSGVMMLQ